MNFRTLARLAIVASALATSVSGVYAYSIHYKGGKYSVTHDKGDRRARGDGTQQITHADAANICAKRDSSIIDTSGGGAKKAMKAVSGLNKLN